MFDVYPFDLTNAFFLKDQDQLEKTFCILLPIFLHGSRLFRTRWKLESWSYFQETPQKNTQNQSSATFNKVACSLNLYDYSEVPTGRTCNQNSNRYFNHFQSTWDLVASAYSNCKPPTNSQIADVSRMCRFGKVPMPHELKPSKHSKGMRELVDRRPTARALIKWINFKSLKHEFIHHIYPSIV